ncbi:GyrI-like domain-containing protein [Caulobacter sp. UNC358MFTsu5.1]|uniref:GyrI-like domain-containing protein n=1 Tax=Caulobacter sp. UNC358MFTsu5.1 TaxID=1449049 RepID=UPI00068CB9BD|nr:GyrI-like domain-containing protein [Caulobacter sp. UNC358MFTsu5.1]
MITAPVIQERPSVPYAAIRRCVTLPFDDEIPGILHELFAGLASQGLTPAGPLFFKHNVIAMPDIEMEFGVPIAEPQPATDTLITGILPAGRFGEVIHRGPYDGLMEANAKLVGWARDHGVVWDSQTHSDGEHFACRLEIYVNGPDDEPAPLKLETIVTIKIAD